MDRKGRLTLFAALTLALVLGQVHAFSIYLTAAEAEFGAGRHLVSLTYSLALIILTITVLVGPSIYRRWSPSVLAATAIVLGVAGLLIAAMAPNLAVVWVGYGLIFGTANGLGYGFGLQIAAQANANAKGLAMGAVTAAYAGGAILGSPVLGSVVGQYGFSAGMLASAASLAVALPIVVGLFKRSGVSFQFNPDRTATVEVSRSDLVKLWTAYALAVFSGLMVIGHASGIAVARSVEAAAWIAPVLVAGFNLCGSLGVAWLSDRIGFRIVLIAMPIMTAGSLLVLIFLPGPAAALPALCAIGFAYGGAIAVWPAAISERFGVFDSPRIYGRVFTAWGAAGLAGPWVAGLLFDQSGHYQSAFLIAAVLGAVGAMAAFIALRQ